MARIRLEFVPINCFALGWFGFDHLQLVFERDAGAARAPQDGWYVLEGTWCRSGASRIVHVVGADGRTTLATANLASDRELIARIGTPETRGSVVLPIDGEALAAWDAMAAFARRINAGHHPYLPIGVLPRFRPVINSSSVVASLLWEIGIDVHRHLPSGMVFSPGTDTLIGGGGRAYALPDGLPDFDTLVGGEADDDLRGSDDPKRLDKLYGGGGNDTFHWTYGTNYIHGGQPGLPTRRDGYDTMDYTGAGRIEIKAGFRRFLRWRPDYLVSFTGTHASHSGGTDFLTSIERLVLDAKTDALSVGPKLRRIPRLLDIEIKGAAFGCDQGCLDLSASRRPATIVSTTRDSVELALGVRRGDRVWRLNGLRRVIGSAHDDLIQMAPSMHRAEGGPGDDVIDARLVTPGLASRFCGYDAEIDGGQGDDVLIACRGRTYARGGDGNNTFVLPRLGEPLARLSPELVVADGKPGDCLLVPDGANAEDRVSGNRLKQVSGVLDGVAHAHPGTPPGAIGLEAKRENGDLVLTLTAPVRGTEDKRPRAANEASRTASVRLLNFRNGCMGISHRAFD